MKGKGFDNAERFVFRFHQTRMHDMCVQPLALIDKKRKKLKIIRSQVRHFDPFHRYGFLHVYKKCTCVVALYICYASNVYIYIFTYLYVFLN